MEYKDNFIEMISEVIKERKKSSNKMELNNDNYQEISTVLKELNNKQRESVLCEDKRILILAGAGSGKTKTLIQKVLYLISEKNVDPRNILAITFTKNAANEMIDRLILACDKENKYQQIISNKKLSLQEKNNERKKYIKKYPWISNISIKTFHGFCNQVLRKRGIEQFDTKYKILMDNRYESEIYTNQQSKESPEIIIKNIIIKLCQDTDYLLELKRYVLDYYVDTYNLKMHKIGLKFYEKPFTSLKGDHVASPYERDVADWLYRHRIKYEYEPKIAPGSFEMKPDFYINEANLFLEVVTKSSFPLSDKVKVMEKAGKNYVKITSSIIRDSNEFNEAMDKIVFTRIEKILKNTSPLIVTEEFKGYESFLRMFVLDVLKMIDKIKVENQNFEQVDHRAQKEEYARVRNFYKLSRPIWENYHSYCIDHSYLDFNDLLIKAVSLFENEEKIRLAYQKRFKYILVDEFQDVNTIQVKLLKLILNDESQLFCVGDDWQSIYGFRGSNVEYIVNFQKYYKNPRLIKLNLNYRSNNTIVEASNELIKHNKFKIEKEISAFNSKGKKIFLYSSQKEAEDGVQTVVKNIDQLLKNGFTKEDILVLSRTRKSEAFDNYYNELVKRKIRITTIHKSKGLEANIVFIIGLTRGYHGFPNIRDDDLIFQVIKKSDYEQNLEEERRLFYVAITRAKKELFLISEVGNESEFISEIPGEFIDRKNFLILNIKPTIEKFCRNCKKKIDEEFLFCPHCGKNISSSEDEEIELKQEKMLEKEINHLILSCLKNVKSMTGRSFLTKILKGSNEKSIFKNKENENPYYGCLKDVSKDKILFFIDRLIDNGYVEIYKDNIPYNQPLIRLANSKYDSKKISIKELKKIYPRAYEKWTEEEEKTLIDEFKNNDDVYYLSRLLKRQPGGIISRLKKLGLIEDSEEVNRRYEDIVKKEQYVNLKYIKSWTKEEDEILKREWLSGASNRKIGIMLGRTEGSISSRANKLKLYELLDKFCPVCDRKNKPENQYCIYCNYKFN